MYARKSRQSFVFRAGFGMSLFCMGMARSQAQVFDISDWNFEFTPYLWASGVSGLGKGGTGVLRVDGKEVASRRMAHILPFLLQFDQSLDVGSDTLTGVNDADYQPPFAFNGKITKITLSIDRPKLSPDDIKKLQAAERAKAASQ